MTDLAVRSPCVGLCSTTYGDVICRGCRRTCAEITNWPGMGDDKKKQVVDRLDQQIIAVLQPVLVLENAELLREQLNSMQLNYDPNRSPWSWLFVLLVKRADLIQDPHEYGFRPLRDDMTLAKLIRKAMQMMYQLAQQDAA